MLAMVLSEAIVVIEEEKNQTRKKRVTATPKDNNEIVCVLGISHSVPLVKVLLVVSRPATSKHIGKSLLTVRSF